MKTNSTNDLDSTDLKILKELQEDASLSNVELAKRVHLSPSPCLARVRALEARGLIRQYVALLDAKQLGLHLNVFICISLKQQSLEALEEFEERIRIRDEVMECYLMTGDADYLLRVAVADMAISSAKRFSATVRTCFNTRMSCPSTPSRRPGCARRSSASNALPRRWRACPSCKRPSGATATRPKTRAPAPQMWMPPT